MRKIWLLLGIAMLAKPAYEQGAGYTQVTGTKFCYQNGSVTAAFVNQSGGSNLPLLNGSVFPQTNVTTFDSNGVFSFYLADNNQIFPTPSQWKITVCGKSAGQPPCGAVTVTVTGPTTDISSQIASLSCGSGGGGVTPGTAGTVPVYQQPGGNTLISSNMTVDSTGNNFSIPNSTSKLPRINLTFPDFGTPAGCSGPASPLNTDNTCQFNAAVAFAKSQGVGGYYPSIYVPGLNFKFTGTIVTTACIGMIGDGKAISSLQEMNPTADLIDIKSDPSFPCTAFPNGATYRDLQFMGNGHNTTGALMVQYSDAGVQLDNVTFTNNAGRGLVVYSASERTNGVNSTFSNIGTISIDNATYERRWFGLTVGTPGQSGDGFCYTVNCLNHNLTLVPPMPPASYTLISASGNGTNATYVMQGNSGVSPLSANDPVVAANITGTTGLNGVSVITAVSNNTPIAGQFTLTTNNNASGTGTVTGATLQTGLYPENRHAAIWVGYGFFNWFAGGEMKSLTYEPAFKFTNGTDQRMTSLYTEGFSNSVNASTLYMGLPDQLIGNGTTTICTVGATNYSCVPVTQISEMWWPEYAGYAADLPTYAATITQSKTAYIFPSNYVPGSTNPSTTPGVQQGQYEIATVAVANDTGLAYFITRNLAGSTAPANSTWVNPIIDGTPTSGATFLNGLTMEDIHYAAYAPGSLQAGYAPACIDGTIYQCSEIQTAMDDGYIHFQGGWGSSSSPTVSMASILNLNDNVAITIKDSARLQLSYWPNGGTISNGETLADLTGAGNLNASNPGYPIVTTTSAGALLKTNGPFLSFTNSLQQGQATYGGFYNNSNPTNIGQNPNWSWGFGYNFLNSFCRTGVPDGSGINFQSCIQDNNNTGKANWQLRTSTNNGTNWTNIFGVAYNAGSPAFTGTLGSTVLAGNSTTLNIPTSMTIGNVSVGALSNLATNTANIAGTAWTAPSGGVTATGNTTDFPDPWGGNTATKLVFSLGNVAWVQNNGSGALTASTTYTTSGFACGALGGEVVSLTIANTSAPSVSLPQCNAAGTSWARIFANITTPGTNLTRNWGIQVPPATTPTIYLAGPTTVLQGLGTAYYPCGATPCPTLFVGTWPDVTKRAGSVTISASTTQAVTFSTPLPHVPTTCQLTPTSSAATTGSPFATSLSATGFTANVPVSGTLTSTYLCAINNAN